MNRIHLLRGLVAVWVVACGTTASATVTYFEIPNYRSVEDSPFRDIAEFYLEDFEDGMLNTPNVSSPTGFVFTVGDVRSVDGDDGVIDGISNGFGALRSTEPVTPFHLFAFTPDALGRYPNFVGVVVTHEPNLSSATDSYSALSGLGSNLPGSRGFAVDDLVAVTNEFGNVAPARFVGLYWSEGISLFGVSRALQLDHLQYSYAAIPEPAPVAQISLAIIGAILRRRRCGYSG